MKNTNPNYLQTITQTAKDGWILPVSRIETELEKVLNVLSSSVKKNPVLIDEIAGSSRLIVENAALKLFSKDAPANLRDRQILRLKNEIF